MSMGGKKKRQDYFYLPQSHMAEDVKCSLATRNEQAGTWHPPEQPPFPRQPPSTAAAPQPGATGFGLSDDAIW